MLKLTAAAIIALAATGPALALDGAASLVEPGAVSSELSEYNLVADDAGTLRVFARSRANFEGARIYVSARRGTAWEAPKPIAFTDERYRDSDPWLTPDGKTLYFISDRPPPGQPDKRDLDIWRATRQGESWGAPEHLGDAVNSPGEELGPELQGGVLYFNSSRAGGPGQLDFYAAKMTGGGFEPARVLPAPLNSPQAEGDFTLTRDGTTALFWSTRGGKGEIYAARRQGDGWAEPVKLPASVNMASFQITPHLSPDGKTLTFASVKVRDGQPKGMMDLYSIATDGLGIR
ncbi:MAG TPA: hypothetical protein VED40_17365 [Azospirillaceae bacterium]|nr:hypothetical protein [Azospirillaceae bacterium]